MNKVQIIHFDDVTPIEAAETYIKFLNSHEKLNDGEGLRFGEFEIDYGEYNTYGDESPCYHVFRYEPVD